MSGVGSDIDTPPTFSQATHRTLAVADLVPIPVRPSPNDLRATGQVLEAVEEQAKRFAFVLNAATPRTTIAVDAVRLLAQHGREAPVTLDNRVDFATSMINGRTAGGVSTRSRSAWGSCRFVVLGKHEITVNGQTVNKQIRNGGFMAARELALLPSRLRGLATAPGGARCLDAYLNKEERMAEGPVTSQQLRDEVQSLLSMLNEHIALEHETSKKIQEADGSEALKVLSESRQVRFKYHCEVHKRILSIVKDMQEMH